VGEEASGLLRAQLKHSVFVHGWCAGCDVLTIHNLNRVMEEANKLEDTSRAVNAFIEEFQGYRFADRNQKLKP